MNPLPLTLASLTDYLDWSHPRLTAQRVTLGCALGRDPDVEGDLGAPVEFPMLAMNTPRPPPAPIEQVLDLARPDDALACHRAAQAWRKAHGRDLQGPAQVMAGRLAQIGELRAALACKATFAAGTRGVLDRLISPQNIWEPHGDRLKAWRAGLMQRRAAPVLQHLGVHGVPEWWHLAAWFTTGNPENLHRATQEAFHRDWRAQRDALPPARLEAEVTALYRSLGTAWRHTRAAANPDHATLVEQVPRWRGPLVFLCQGRPDLVQRLAPTLLTDLNVGMGLLRPEDDTMSTDAQDRVFEHLVWVKDTLGDGLELDRARWHALATPRQHRGFRALHDTGDVVNRWRHLLQAHPEWMRTDPLKPGVVDLLRQHPELNALCARAEILAQGHPLPTPATEVTPMGPGRPRSGPRRS
jgi:hypothetical protein